MPAPSAEIVPELLMPPENVEMSASRRCRRRCRRPDAVAAGRDRTGIVNAARECRDVTDPTIVPEGGVAADKMPGRPPRLCRCC